jgi:hypothetical protein
MPFYHEKRDFLRMPIDCSFTYTFVDDDRVHHGKVINLSSKGILFTSKQRVEPGTVLDIVLAPSHPTTPPTRVKAEAARVNNYRQFYEIACKFIESER